MLPNSYPSGHMMGTVILALGTLPLSSRRSLRVALLLYVGGMGLSRVYIGDHWTSDVLGGALLAWALVATCWAIAGLPVPLRRQHDDRAAA